MIEVWKAGKLAGRPVHLPVLVEKPTRMRCSDWPDRCQTCPLLHNPCPGCSFSYLSVCAQETSPGACGSCMMASDARETEAVSAVCCKSPLRDFAVDFIRAWWNAPLLHSTDRWEGDVGLVLHHKWGVNLHGDHWPAYGVRLSSIMRKRIPPDRLTSFAGRAQLPEEKPRVCISVGNDRWTEKQGEVPDVETMRALGVTHWTPHAWSVYYNDGHMNQLFNLARIRKSLVVSRAHFVIVKWPLGLTQTLVPWYSEMLRSVPNLFLNLTQGMTKEVFTQVYRMLKALHDVSPNLSVLAYGIDRGRENLREAMRKHMPKWSWYYVDNLGPREIHAST